MAKLTPSAPERAQNTPVLCHPVNLLEDVAGGGRLPLPPISPSADASACPHPLFFLVLSLQGCPHVFRGLPTIHILFSQSLEPKDQRDGSVAESSRCSSKVPGFKPQHPRGRLTLQLWRI